MSVLKKFFAEWGNLVHTWQEHPKMGSYTGGFLALDVAYTSNKGGVFNVFYLNMLHVIQWAELLGLYDIVYN
jgi:hypothetical protein